MRARNIKINVYLNEEEKKMLEEKSTKTKLFQSDFIRNLIEDFDINYSSKNDIAGLTNIISENINNLTKLKNKIHYLGYFREEELIQRIISSLNGTIREP